MYRLLCLPLLLSLACAPTSSAGGKGDVSNEGELNSGEDAGAGEDGGTEDSGANADDGGTDGGDTGSDGGADGGSADTGGSDGGTDGGTDGGDDGVPDVSCIADGVTWSVDLAGGNWVEPAGVGSFISGAIEDQPLLTITGVSGSEISMAVSVAADGECVDFPTADFSDNPSFDIGPVDVEFSVSGYFIPVSELEMSGTFSSDCSTIEDLRLAGALDVRDMGDIFEGLVGTSDPGTICSYLSFLGASCGACSDGEDYCLGVEVQEIPAEETDSLTCR
jgi:hypothetical protein